MLVVKVYKSTSLKVSRETFGEFRVQPKTAIKVFDGSAKSFPSRVCHASCCLGGLGHSDNSGTDPKHPRKCRFCTKVLPDDAVVAR